MNTAWFDTFFPGIYTKVLASQFPPETTAQQVDVVRRLLRLRKGQRVLDVPCGMGRMTIPLAERGLRMTGVDLTPAYVRRARAAARRAGRDIRFITGDMRELTFEGAFDAAFNWFGSFGYFSDEENLAFARRLRAAVRPGGRVLIEGINKSFLRSHFREADEWRAGPVTVRNHRRWTDGQRRLADRWTLSDGKRRETHDISIRIFDAREMRALLGAAGFREVELFGYPTLRRLTRHSIRLLAVARRPGKGGRS